jgi:hypothetical protein
MLFIYIELNKLNLKITESIFHPKVVMEVPINMIAPIGVTSHKVEKGSAATVTFT